MRALVTGASGFVGGPPHPPAARARRTRCAAWCARRAAARSSTAWASRSTSAISATAACCARRSTAATWSFTAPPTIGSRSASPDEIYRSNVTGSENLFAAAAEVGVGRVVYTSSVATLGLSSDGTAASESAPSTLGSMIGAYKRSKFLAERVADSFVAHAQAADRDRQPVDAGRRGRRAPDADRASSWSTSSRAASPPTSTPGSTSSTCATSPRGTCWRPSAASSASATSSATATSRSPSCSTCWRASPACAGRACVCRTSCRCSSATLEAPLARLRRRPPRVSLEAVRLARKKMFFDPAKAVRELGLPQSPIETRARARRRLVSRAGVRDVVTAGPIPQRRSDVRDRDRRGDAGGGAPDLAAPHAPGRLPRRPRARAARPPRPPRRGGGRDRRGRAAGARRHRRAPARLPGAPPHRDRRRGRAEPGPARRRAGHRRRRCAGRAAEPMRPAPALVEWAARAMRRAARPRHHHAGHRRQRQPPRRRSTSGYGDGGAAVVDLESAAYAEAADDAGVPWLVLRAVADTADESLPAVARRLPRRHRRDPARARRLGAAARSAPAAAPARAAPPRRRRRACAGARASCRCSMPGPRASRFAREGARGAREEL